MSIAKGENEMPQNNQTHIDRLTNDNGWLTGCDELCDKHCVVGSIVCPVLRHAINQLSAYEDNDMSPEEVKWRLKFQGEYISKREVELMVENGALEVELDTCINSLCSMCLGENDDFSQCEGCRWENI